MENQTGLKSVFNKRIVFPLLGIAIFVIAIGLTVYMVQQKQLFKPKAAGLPTPTPSSDITVPTPSAPKTGFSLSYDSGVPYIVGTPYVVHTGDKFNVGDKIKVTVSIISESQPANLFVAKLKFPKDLVNVTSLVTTNQQAQNSSDPIIIKNWAESKFSNQAGTISLVGGIPSPGFPYVVGPNPTVEGRMAEIFLTAVKAGNVTFDFDSGTAIYANSDNSNILTVNHPANFQIEAPAPTPTTVVPTNTPTPTLPPSSTPTPTSIPGIRGDINGDGQITLQDLSKLLSTIGSQTGSSAYNLRADLNLPFPDGLINSVDYSLMIGILTQAGVFIPK